MKNRTRWILSALAVALLLVAVFAPLSSAQVVRIARSALLLPKNLLLPKKLLSLAPKPASTAMLQSSSPAQGDQALLRTAARSGQSLPLRDIPPKVTRQDEPDDNENPIVRHAYPGMGQPSGLRDAAIPSLLVPNVMPAPIQNFDGEYNQYGPIPPDTNGDVGLNHYVQIVNSGFTIFNKTGTVLYGPTNNNVLFTGFGGICETTNAGDPVALYDRMADRWILNWFTGQSNPTHQCFAVSTGPDPLGSWYRYDFVTSPVTTAFEDYPHLGIWPDAYYMTTNEFGTASGGGNYAFERAKMLSGDPAARMIYFPSADGGLLPSDFDGTTPPPAGSPNFFFEWFDTSHLAEYKFHVDWSVPALSTFTGPTLIPVTPFNFPTCTRTREQCVPQPGTTALLETIGDRLMYRVVYRNFGTYESLVLNHTVNATGGNPGFAAPRWYELRDPNNAAGASVFQQGTFYPDDGVYRWMGSIAQDKNGDIAMGYSASSSALFPSIRYAGRLPTDPLGTFGQGEATLIAGGGSEDFPSAPRWGDYSNIAVDPADGCTFWYTQEYFSVTGLRDWRTRIGSFKFPSCTASTPTPTPTNAVPTATATPTPSPTPTPTFCAGATTTIDSVTNAQPTQTGRLGLSDPKSRCAVPKAVSAFSDSLTRHYRSYTYTNSSGSTQCVTVAITQDCGNNAVQSIAYLGSFNPASIQTNYLADGGASGHSFSYSFSLPAGQTAVIVVVEVSPNLGCTTYTMSINPCGPPATNTPTGTPTNTPVLPTNTPTGTPTNTRTNTPPPSPTLTFTATNTPTPPPTFTNSPTRTNTPANTPTVTPGTPTSTNTPTNTRTNTRTNTPANTPTVTPGTPTSTNTPTNTPGALTPTPTPTKIVIIPPFTNFRDVRRPPDINVGPDLGGTGHTAFNFTGSTGAGGDTWITVYDTTPADDTVQDKFGSIILSGDMLIHRFNNKKGPGLLALFNEGAGQKGLALVVYDNGNTDSLVLGTMNKATGTFTALATVALANNIGEDQWYRMTMDVVVSGPSVTVTGKLFRHTVPTDPNSALGAQVGGTLTFGGTLGAGSLTGISSPGEVGMAAQATSAIVDSSITNFVIDP